MIEEARKVAFGICSIIFAGLSLALFWVPFLNAGLALIGCILGIIGLFVDTDKIPSIIGLVASFIMLLIGVGWTALLIYLWNAA